MAEENKEGHALVNAAQMGLGANWRTAALDRDGWRTGLKEVASRLIFNFQICFSKLNSKIVRKLVISAAALTY